MIASQRPDKTLVAVLSGAFLVCAISAHSIRSSAQTPNAAVMIGGNPISDEHVSGAVAQCRSNAPELTAKECVDRFWVPRWLLDAEAKEQKLAVAPPLLQKRRDILSTRLLELHAEQAREPNPSEIDSYLKKHEREFVKPLRVRIFRILVKTEQAALEILAKLGATTSISDFRKLARDHSVDKATNERGGDLGFVWPDGSTDVPQVSADPALYAAAIELADGEFSKSPIAEGDHFAVLWRRGSLPATARDDSSRNLARARLQEEYATQTTTSLLTELGRNVAARNDELLGKLRRPEASLFREP